MKANIFFAIGLLLSGPASAQGYDWAIVGRVTAIEVSYMPNSLLFKSDTTGGSCAAGSLLNWGLRGTGASETGQNAQSVLATLLSAQLSGHTVTIYGSDSGCVIRHLYIN